jgi:hypothetical protein
MILEEHIRVAGNGCEAIVCNVRVVHGGVVQVL